MPEHDFELYLSLLSRFLRLKPTQHAEIADELRDHLEERLAELTARGLSHDEAIRQALDEFGDAAELAQHFTRTSHIRRRRLIMRCTLGTIGAAAALLFFVTAFWPAAPTNGIAVKAVADDPPATAAPAADSKPNEVARSPGEKWGFLLGRGSEKIVESLDRPTEATFVDLPLEDAVSYLKDFHQINVWIDRPALDGAGVKLDSPITLQLSGISFRSMLKLLLEPLGLTYVVEDEVLKITTPKKATNLIAVYNIREMVGSQALAAAGDEHAFPMMMPHAGHDDEDQATGLGVRRSRPPGVAPPMSGMAAGSALMKRRMPIYSTSSLAELVTRTIAPETWIESGGTGSAVQYNGVLVIRNSQVVHEQVRSFLKLLQSTLDNPVPQRGKEAGGA